jgi:TRAP-type C4-dicarboxylate transport system permease small subunit
MPEDLTMEVHDEKRELTGHNRKLVWVARSMTAIGAVMLSIIMFVSIADIAGRNLLRKPVEGTHEIVSLLVVVVGVLGMGYCQLVKGNVNIDVVTKRLSHRGQAILNSISYLIAIGVCTIIAWQMLLRTWDYMHRTLGSETVILGIPFWPFMLLTAVCFIWVLAIFCLDFYKALREVFQHGTD